MEVLNSSSSSDQPQTEKSRKKRHRKAKVCKQAKVSERLKPDFDPINAIVQNASTPTNLEKETVKKIVLRDIDSVLKSYPKLIHNYLLKVLQFLQSDQTELCFPNIAPFKDEFLVKIAQDPSLLNDLNFWDDSSVQTAKQILDIVGRNKDVYKWTCMYVNGKVNKNVLVYKKVCINKSQNNQGNSSTSSIESGLKRMTITQDRQDLIHPSFKISMLNTTLKFIKDPTRLTLEYPEMTRLQAQYMHNLILPNNEKDGDLGFGFKSMHSVLYESINKLKEKYDFQISIQNAPNFTVILILSKIPKTNETQKREDKKNNSMDLNSSLTSTSSSETKHLSKSQREYRSRLRIVTKLPENFIKSSLEKFLDFIEDKLMASLEFKNVNIVESRFFESLIPISRSEDYYKLFSSECEVLLKRISRAIRCKEWNLTLSVGKLSRQTEKRTIVFYKTPTFETKSDAQIKPVSQTQKPDIINNGAKLNKALEITSKEDCSEQKDAKVGSDKDSSKNIAPAKNQSIRKPIAFLNGGGSLSKDTTHTDDKKIPYSEVDPDVTQNGSTPNVTQKRSNPNVTQNGSIPNMTQNGLNPNVTQNGSNPNVTQKGSNPNVTQNGSNPNGTRADPPPASRKARLLLALTTPMESNRAERMMRMMGWEGGALGLRGDGITEPIIPALHIAPGAGLGHIKQLANHSAAEYRLKFLQTLLSFLKSSSNETGVEFHQAMTKRETSFVKHTMDAFNIRRKIGLNDPEEVGLVDNIVEEITKDPHLHIDFQIREDKKELRLIKTMRSNVVQKTKRKKKSKSKNPHDVTISNDVIDILDITKDIEGICPTKKAAQNLAYKIKYLEKIKEFLNDENDFAEYKFDCILNKKHKTYIQNVITDINKNAATVRFSEIENDLVRDIRKVANGCYMNVTFNEQTFRLHKKFSNKRTVNPAQSLPPPKSTDLKNTIIYQNNVAKPANECDSHNENSNNNINNDITDDDYEIEHTDNNVAKQADEYNSHNENSINNIDKDMTDDDHAIKCDDNNVAKQADEYDNHNENSNNNIDKDMTDDDHAIKYDDNNIAKQADEYDNHNENNNNNIDNDMTDVDLIHEDDIVTIHDKSMDTDEDAQIIKQEKEFPKNDDALNYETDNDKNNESDVPVEVFDTSDDMFLDISNDSLLLDLLEKENNICNTDYNFEFAFEEEVNNNHDFKDKNGINTDGESHKENINAKTINSFQSNNLAANNDLKPKKCEVIKYVSISSKDNEHVSIDLVKLVQKKISDVIETIDDKDFLPFLRCHGIENGELIYSCHSEYSYNWLKNINIFFASEVEINDTDVCENVLKLRMRVNSFIKEEASTVFNRLKLYYPEADTEEWKIINEFKNEHYVQYDLTVDEKSFKFISENGFSLFVGIDKAQFNILWD